ncbi:MAG: hypothetical protein C0167_02055 [Nitrososphaera sp.]|nr:MAG: hypothetical protein C0167_02055 [Nitrososphaera sp.]
MEKEWERREKAARKLDVLLTILEEKQGGASGFVESDIQAVFYICRMKPKYVVRIGAEGWEIFDAELREFPDIDEVIELAKRLKTVFELMTPKNKYYVLL